MRLILIFLIVMSVSCKEKELPVSTPVKKPDQQKIKELQKIKENNLVKQFREAEIDLRVTSAVSYVAFDIKKTYRLEQIQLLKALTNKVYLYTNVSVLNKIYKNTELCQKIGAIVLVGPDKVPHFDLNRFSSLESISFVDCKLDSPNFSPKILRIDFSNCKVLQPALYPSKLTSFNFEEVKISDLNITNSAVMTVQSVDLINVEVDKDLSQLFQGVTFLHVSGKKVPIKNFLAKWNLNEIVYAAELSDEDLKAIATYPKKLLIDLSEATYNKELFKSLPKKKHLKVYYGEND